MSLMITILNRSERICQINFTCNKTPILWLISLQQSVGKRTQSYTNIKLHTNTQRNSEWCYMLQVSNSTYLYTYSIHHMYFFTYSGSGSRGLMQKLYKLLLHHKLKVERDLCKLIALHLATIISLTELKYSYPVTRSTRLRVIRDFKTQCHGFDFINRVANFVVPLELHSLNLMFHKTLEMLALCHQLLQLFQLQYINNNR